MRAGALILFGALAASCGPLEEAPLASAVSREAIVGGVAAPSDLEVFMLRITYPDLTETLCSATLIASRTLLTAAHCVDPDSEGVAWLRVRAANKPSAGQTLSSDYIEVVETRLHPSWAPTSSLDHDLAVVRLASAPAGVTPKAWNSASISALTGQPLRAVGYGTIDSANTGGGTRRTVDLTFREITSVHISVGDLSGKGICQGDSGGPSFHTFPDGVERVVGVHSYTRTSACVDGSDVRVDAYEPFISQWLFEKESPTCEKDGKCLAGCAPVDQDCACAADGQCTSACTNLVEDPDCPAACAPNGVCATESCPSADLDCVPLGGRCGSELQCPGRQCVSDLQHEGFYCSVPCSQTADCPSGMVCEVLANACVYRQLPSAAPHEPCDPAGTYCTQGTVCLGPPDRPYACRKPCATQSDCVEGSCITDSAGLSYCLAPPKAVSALQSSWSEGPAAGCSATGGGGMLWALLWLASPWFRRRLRA